MDGAAMIQNQTDVSDRPDHSVLLMQIVICVLLVVFGFVGHVLYERRFSVPQQPPAITTRCHVSPVSHLRECEVLQ